MIHNFCINDFEGPLYLLLHLIRSSKMDIYDINIESITRQYLEFINANKDLSMDDSSEYLVMAAELIHLKSKLLLNKDDDEDEDSEFELNSFFIILVLSGLLSFCLDKKSSNALIKSSKSFSP